MNGRHITVDGVETHLLDAGGRTAPAVVLLHGGAFGEAAETTWWRNIDALAVNGRVVIIASKASHTLITRLASGMVSPLRPSG